MGSYPDWIGITGLMGSGKTTVAGMLVGHITGEGVGPVALIGFATALKDMAYRIGWDGKKDEAGRRLLQVLGTEVVRECIDPDYWVKEFERSAFARWATIPGNDDDAVADEDKTDLIVIADDVRFNNEAEFIRERRGLVIEVLRPASGTEDETDVIKYHGSEQGIKLEYRDSVLLNNGSLELLAAKVGILHIAIKEAWDKQREAIDAGLSKDYKGAVNWLKVTTV